jgi:hypothetical protein
MEEFFWGEVNIFTPVPGVVDDTCPKLKGDWLPVIEEV